MVGTDLCQQGELSKLKGERGRGRRKEKGGKRRGKREGRNRRGKGRDRKNHALFPNSSSLATSYQRSGSGSQTERVTCHGSMKPRAVLVMATPCNHHLGDACLEEEEGEKRKKEKKGGGGKFPII